MEEMDNLKDIGNEDDTQKKDISYHGSKWLSCFMIATYLGFFASLFSWSSRTMIPAALIGMTPPHGLAVTDIANGNNNLTLLNYSLKSDGMDRQYQEFEFHWSRTLQGFIISSVNYGSLVGSLFGSTLPNKFGVKKVTLIAVFLVACFTALSPIGARIHVAVYIGMNALSGACSAIVRIATVAMVGSWAPIQERAIMCVIQIQGIIVGITLTYFSVGFLISTGIDGGWPMPFYVTAALQLTWCPFWMYFYYNTPEQHPRISEEEKQYILSNKKVQNTEQSHKVPWKAMLTSPQFWLLIVITFLVAVCLAFLQALLPSYITDIHTINPQQVSIIATIITMPWTILLIPIGIVMDYLATRYSVSFSRKSLLCAGCFSYIPFIILAGFLGSGETILAVTVLTMATVSLSVVTAVVNTLPVDVAPNFAGVMGAMSLIAFNLALIISPAPILTATENGILEEWRTIFMGLALLMLISGLLYLFAGSADVHDWAQKQQTEKSPLVEKEE